MTYSSNLMRSSRLLGAVCTIGLCALGAPAQAQEVAAAKKMFDQGLANMEAGNFDKGCPAIEASYKLDPVLARCSRWPSARTSEAGWRRRSRGMTVGAQYLRE